MHILQTENRAECTKFWLDPELGNLEFLHATYVTHSFVPHTHDGFAIGVVERGAETFTYRKGRHVAGEGRFVIINPGEPHTGQAVTPEGWTYRMLYPDASLLQAAASQLAGQARGTPFFPNPVVADDELATQFLRTHAILEVSTSSLERQSRLLWMFTHLIARHADDRPRPSDPLEAHYSVACARDYLEAHYAEDVSLAQLAGIANLSPYHLLRQFRQVTGFTPHAYVTQVRVSRAKRMLLAGQSITQVALATGFTDQSHLTRRFKQIVGVTPGSYQQSNNLQDALPALM
jgi:AraC-like DNA-binding protein